MPIERRLRIRAVVDHSHGGEVADAGGDRNDRGSSGEEAAPSLPEIFAEYWPSYRAWIRRSSTSDPDECVAALRHHMPELVPLLEDLAGRLGADPEIVRFLTLYAPPRLVRGCSQVVLESDDGPVLLRSYDHHPRLFDGVVLASRWGGCSALALMDCLWGALDGINERGCAVALAFGGRNVIGPGFAAPLVVRYILQTCTGVDDARNVLARVPVSMPYTFVVADATGAFITAHAAPDRATVFAADRASTNHQGLVEWEAYAGASRSVERLERLESLLEQKAAVDRAREAFLRPPIWRTDTRGTGGTLYVAEYTPTRRTLALHWPERTERVAIGGPVPVPFEVILPG